MQVGPEHPFFYARVSSFLIRAQRAPPKEEQEVIQALCNEEFDDLSRRIDRTGIQHSVSVRNVLKTRLMAIKLIGEDGELEHQLLVYFIQAMEEKIASLAPGREHDLVRDRHILSVLRQLHSNKEIARMLRSITRPYSNRLAEQIIRDTLNLPTTQSITDVHVRRACLAAWLCSLRQSLGSCFATAPAILVQQEQAIYFLKDLDEMMSTGSMRKVFAGREYSVPMSDTWGNGDLRKPIVLERDLARDENSVWMSPGILTALDAGGVFAEGKTIAQKTHECRKRLVDSISLIDKPGSTIVTNAEEIIEALLLNHFGITKSDVSDFLNRPKTMMQSSLVVYIPKEAMSREKGETIPGFLAAFAAAKRAFKMLEDNALLKSWEFTIASFSEMNMNFARWNLYASLGINYDDIGGIGHCLHQLVSNYVEEANLAFKEQEIEYNEIVSQMHYLEGRARMASTEKEINWVKMEYQSRQTELYHIEQLRNMAYQRAQKIANLNSFLIDEYDRLFPDYFQEVYDAEIHDIAQGPYDDSPAGFRLLYKYGRTNSSLWTKIYSLPEFIEALVSFFTITEVDIRTKPQVAGIETEFSQLVTQLVGHVRSDFFMETSLFRMAKAHGATCPEKPLENLDKVEKKPWVYTSGGSMGTLVSAYFRREEKPTDVTRWVENETELFAFIIDTIKQLPATVSDLFLADMNRSMLIHSPTHAFLLKPGFFSRAWNSDQYSYSWIKHAFVEPAHQMHMNLHVDEEMGAICIEELLYLVGQDFRPRFRQVFEKLPYRLSASDFRDYIVNTMHVDRGLRTFRGPVLPSDDIDSVLYSHLPYIAKERVLPILEEVLREIFPQANEKEIASIVHQCLTKLDRRGYISAKKLLELCKVCALFLVGATKTREDIHGKIVNALRKRGLALASPVIFADSNWVKDYFAFVVSPTTSELELWSVDYHGFFGRPISYWKQWVNGSRRDPKWGIYSKPLEYVR